MNNTAYTNTNLLEVTTIENFIYMEMKNDVSFMLDCTLNLFEHQSSNNPNMPLRGLFYFAQHYGKIVSNKALHNHTLIKIPTPRYVVFYNGKEQLPERKVLRLSDAFYNKSVEGSIEVEATIININYGKNKDIMDKCKVLFEYSTFIQIVREYVGNVEYSTKEIAINEAIQYCIEHGILARLLREHRAEVIDMFFSEYTLEDAIEDAKIEARENAIKEVRETVIKEVRETVIKEVRENVMKEAKEIAMKEAREEVFLFSA